MTSPNVELARDILAAISERNVPRLIELSHPEVEWHSFFAVGQSGGLYRGHDGTRTYMGDVDDAFDIAVAEVDDLVAVGDVVVLVGRIRFRGKGSGVESHEPAGWVLKFRDGKLLRFRAFREPERALESVGMSP